MIAPSFRSLVAVASAALMLMACGEDATKMLASARDYRAKGDYNAATIQLKNVLQKDPQNAEARFMFGMILQDSGDLVGAERELRKAYDAGYSTEQLALPFSRALIAMDKGKEAIKLIGGMRADTPAAKAAVAAGVADAFLATGDKAGAQTSVDRALQAVPGFPAARLTQARLKAMAPDLDGALAIVDEVLAHEPKSYEALMLRGEIRLAKKQNDEAVHDFVAAADARPRLIMPRLRAAQILLAANKIEDAKVQLAEASKISATHPMLVFAKGVIALAEGKNEQARDNALQVLRSAPDYMQARVLAGLAHLKLKEMLQAQEQFEKVVAKMGNAPTPRRLLARAYLAGQEPGRALEALSPLIGLDSRDRESLMLAGEAALSSGNQARASEYYERVTKLDPNDTTARARLGVVRLVGGDTDHAIADLAAAAALDEHATPVDAALVSVLMQKGDLKQARKVAEQLVAKQPKESLPYNLLGAVKLADKDAAGARQAFTKALEIDPDYLAAVTNLGQLDIAEGKTEQAIARMNKLIEHSPKQVEAYLALARWSSGPGHKPDAVKAVLEKGIAANPSNVQLRTAYVGELLRAGDKKATLAAARELVTRAPNDPSALATAVQAQAVAGDSEEAAATVKKLVALRPSAPEPLLLQADLLQRSGATAETEDALRRAVKLDADGKAQARQRLGVFLLSQRKFDEADSIAKDMLSRQPNSLPGLLLAADVATARKDHAAAAAGYAKALAIRPDPAIAARVHASLVAAGKASDADAFAKKWLAEHPKDLGFRAYQADVALRAPDYPQAVRAYKAMLEIQPKNPVVLNNLAWAAAQTKDPLARSYAEQALALAPDSAAVLDTLAMIQIDSGDVQGGITRLKRAVTLEPERNDLRLNLARALIKAGDKAGAKGELDLVLAKSNADAATRRDAESLRKTL
ncbi:XrtA/PEP-CTERM system TPR-repeat protein PrsT [Niveibacterium sp. SC-1]|uniref:XrtA/PEP-CTERM system TPR-repeat protein PrsT n=1 Tax=Niveibacterium sp. SC-1 TaxID=3135646 RepID=UPI00311D4FD8